MILRGKNTLALLRDTLFQELGMPATEVSEHIAEMEENGYVVQDNGTLTTKGKEFAIDTHDGNIRFEWGIEEILK